MKLIDLLKIELPKRGGWPKGADYVVQDYDKEIRFHSLRIANFYSSERCNHSTKWSEDLDINSKKVVTREQYEQAMSQPQKHTAHSFLEKGVQHMKDRAAQRDSEGGERSMKACVNAFNAMFGHSLTETQGWQFMVLLKMARSRNKFNPDDYEDGAAYTGLAGEAHSNEKK